MADYSIILPVLNGGKYVKECINSILSQTIHGFNLIVLDSGSTDGTTEWIQSLNNSKISFYTSSKELSIEDNWNRIKQIPRNEFMTIIGHDDLLFPNYLEEMDKLIKQNPDASLYQAHFRFINQNGDLIQKCKPMKPIQYADEFLLRQITEEFDSMGTGYMMRSRDFDAVGGMPNQYQKLIFADYELWIRLILIKYKATTPVECFSYRIHSSTSALTNGEEYQQAFFSYLEFLCSLKLTHPKIETVIKNKGKDFLLNFCQSLSHRLLKTPSVLRKTSVMEYIKKCNSYAEVLIPNQSFYPLLKPKILAAFLLDNKWGLKIFRIYKLILNQV